MSKPNPNVQPPDPQPEGNEILPLTVDGWNFSQQLDSPLSAENPDPQATLDAVHDLRKRYGEDNVMIGPGYSDEGERDDNRMSIYLRERVKPRGLARRIGASILGQR